MMLRTVTAAIAGLAMASSLAMADGYVKPVAYPQPEDPSEFYSLVEIPAGSSVKYEVDDKTGHILVDRFMAMPVVYPANYGSVPSSLAGDGDPLDVLVFTRAPVMPGALMKVRAIGVLKMVDGGETDDKIIAVPTSKVDPTYDNIKSINDLPEIERERLEAFFRVYKQLPKGGKIVELGGFEDADKAQAEVVEALRVYREKHK